MFFHKAKAERVGRIWERVWGERSSIKKLSNFLFAYKNYIFHSNKWVRDCERWWRMGCTRLNPWIRPKKNELKITRLVQFVDARERGRFGWDEKLNEEKISRMDFPHFLLGLTLLPSSSLSSSLYHIVSIFSRNYGALSIIFWSDEFLIILLNSS